MIDLTKNTTPFSLLDAKTQAAFKAHKGAIEYWNGCYWLFCAKPQWSKMSTYRVRPEPPKPREIYVATETYGDTKPDAFHAFATKIDAEIFSKRDPHLAKIANWKITKFIEVIE